MAIIYSYPKVTSPLATDVLVLTDTTLTAGKRKNKTKSLAMSDLATYVVSSTSGITGSGTINTIPLFTPSGVKLGDSIIIQDVAGNGIAVRGSAAAESLAVLGSTLLVGALTAQGASTFSNVSFQGVVFDGGGNPGTAGQVLSSTGAGGDTEWINNTDANTTYNLFGATSNVNEYAISLSGSDGSLDKVNLIPGSNITLTSSATGVTIDADSTSALTAESIVQPIIADGALVKGDPVYITGFNNGQDKNIVAKADSSDPAKMPVVGISNGAYANNGAGFMTAFGSFNGAFDTTGGAENWSVGDVIYVKPGGGLTNIKPGGTDLVQNIAIVSRVQQNTGELEVIALGRTNDVPNLPEGRLFVGTATNTSLASDVVYVDDVNGNVGIRTTSPQSGFVLDVNGQSVTRGVVYLQDRLEFFNSSTANISSFSDVVINVNGSERARFNTAGNVGIGTTSPDRKLHVKDGAVVVSEFEGTSAGSLIDLVNSNASQTYNGIRFTQGTASKMAITHIADGTTKGYVQIGNGYATGSEILVVDGRTSNVGIGTTSPSARLEVQGTNSNTQAALKVTDSGDSFFEVVPDNNTTFKIGDLDAVGDEAMIVGTFSDITFSKGGTTTMILDSNNRVGIGTTSPLSKLQISSGSTAETTITIGASGNIADVASRIILNEGELGVSNSTNYGFSLAYAGDGSYGIPNNTFGIIRHDNSAAGAIVLSAQRTTGNVGIGTDSPIYELDVAGEGRFTGVLRCLSLVQTSQTDKKEGIQNIDKTKAKAIQFKEYRYKEDRTSRKRYGVLAEDLEKEYPELVYTGSDGVKGISYTDLLIKRVAELEQELEQISVDGLNGNVFVNKSSKFIGIGTTKPGAKLEVVGDLKMKDEEFLPHYLTMSPGRKDVYINKDLNNTVFFGDNEQPSTTNISVAADIESRGGGLVLTSPKGLKFKITVGDRGELISTEVTPTARR